MFWKLIIAGAVILMAVLSQYVINKPCILAHEEVVLGGNRQEAFDFLTKIEKYSKWHPGLGPIEAADSSPQLHIGKMFTEYVHYPILGDVKYSLVIAGYNPSTFLSISSDGPLKPVYEITLKAEGDQQTRIYIKVISRRKSYLFNFTIAPFARFAYKQQLLQALFNLRMLFRQA